jgi:hypothetical protein
MSIWMLVPRACAHATKALVRHLIVQPFQGLKEVVNGIAQAGPDLYQAASDAVVEAVDSRLSMKARQNVRLGTERVLAGAQLLAAPAALAVTVFIFFHPNVLWAAWLVVLATSVAV